jgi:hypothetical protein
MRKWQSGIFCCSKAACRDRLVLTLVFSPFLTGMVVASSREKQMLGFESPVKAWWRGLRLVFARPVATLGSYMLITAVGLILLALLGIARINSPHATFSGSHFASAFAGNRMFLAPSAFPFHRKCCTPWCYHGSSR